MWVNTVGLCEFDPILFAAHCTGPLLNIAGAVPIEQVSEVIGQVTTVTTQSLEAVTLEKCSDQNLEVNIKAVYLKFVLPFPTPLRDQGAASVTRRWIIALEKGKSVKMILFLLSIVLERATKGLWKPCE